MKLKDIEKSTNKNLYLLFLSVLVGLTAGFWPVFIGWHWKKLKLGA